MSVRDASGPRPLPSNAARLLFIVWCSVLLAALDGQTCDLNLAPGLCTTGTGMDFKFPETLPSGGHNSTIKLTGLVAGSSTSASFFFTFDGTEEVNGTVGVDFTYECRKTGETTFAPCSCEISPSGQPWGACQQYYNVGELGTFQFYVRAVQLRRVGDEYLRSSPEVVTSPATFVWRIDTVAPIAIIGRYVDQSGTLLGGAPPPCHLPSPAAVFEITANEFPRHLECRLSKWVEAYADFDNAMERWSALTVQLWLADPKHLDNVQVKRNLSNFAEQFKNITGLQLSLLDDNQLQRPPFSYSEEATRLAILAAISDQKTPFQSCRTNLQVPAFSKAYDRGDLDHGLTLFQLRAVDSAGNIGIADEYIWFVDLLPPAVSFDRVSEAFVQSSRVNFTISGVEATPSDAIGIRFKDHDGIPQECDHYSYRLILDGFDITPRDRILEDSFTYIDDMNARNLQEYRYEVYSGDRAPVLNGQFREFKLSIVPTDKAGNVGAAYDFRWTIDRRVPITSLTDVPEALSNLNRDVRFSWFCDEDGISRNLSFVCRVDDGPAFTCPNSSYVVPSFLGTEGVTTHTFSVLTIDEAGNEETAVRLRDSKEMTSFNKYSWVIDTSAPTARFIGQPEVPEPFVKTPQFTFDFVSSKAGGGFRCTLTVGDASPKVVRYKAIAHPTARGQLVLPDALDGEMLDGAYSLKVEPIDLAGTIGDPITADWVLDRVPPSVILATPAGHNFNHITASDHVTFEFATPPQFKGEAISFQCAIDCLFGVETCQDHAQDSENLIGTPPATVCGPHFTPLLQNYTAKGSDILAVKTGGRGFDRTSTCRDLRGPSSQPRYFGCGSSNVTLVGLSKGRHVFRVRAVDPAGNVGEPTQYGWRVDLDPPTAQFRSNSAALPPRLSNLAAVTLQMTADEGLASYLCRLQCPVREVDTLLIEQGTMTQLQAIPFGQCEGRSGDMVPCPENVQFTELASGLYRFQTRAVDQVGNPQTRITVNGVLEDSFTEHFFAIDRTPAPVELVSFNAKVTSVPFQIFEFESTEEDVVFQCQYCRYFGDNTDACTEYELCDPTGTVIQTVQERVEDQPMFTKEGARPCLAALLVNCQRNDFHQGQGDCSNGFLDLCQVTQFGFASPSFPTSSGQACQGSPTDQEFLQCTQRFPIKHLFRVRTIDRVGNVGPPVSFSWLYDNIRPTTVNVSASAGIVSPKISRPYATRSGTLQSSGLSDFAFTRDRTISFDFEVAGESNSYSSRCYFEALDSGAVGPEVDCTSPVLYDADFLDGSAYADLGLVGRFGGQVGLIDGTYKWTTVATDETGNVGDPTSFTWTIASVDPETKVLVGPSLTKSWTNDKDIRVYFACNQPSCTFQCRLEYLEATPSNNIGPRTLVDWVPCGDEQARMAITLNTLGNAASIAANFLAAPETKLVQQLQTVFVDAEITDVEVLRIASDTVKVSILVTKRDGVIFSDLQALPDHLIVADGYNGTVGPGCDCSNGCTVEALCMIEGVFTRCPCISNYRGSGLFPIISVQYDGLSPVTISVAAVGPETLPQAGTEFASYKFSIRSFLEGSEGPISSQQVNIDTKSPVLLWSMIPPAVASDFVQLGLSSDQEVLHGKGEGSFACSWEGSCSLCGQKPFLCKSGNQLQVPSAPATLVIEGADEAGNSAEQLLRLHLEAIGPIPQIEVLSSQVFLKTLTTMFSSDQIDTTFECSPEDNVWVPCTSPWILPLQENFLPTIRARSSTGRISSTVCLSDAQTDGCVQWNVVEGLVDQSIRQADSCTPLNSSLLVCAILLWVLVLLLGSIAAVLLWRARHFGAFDNSQRHFSSKRAFHNPLFNADVSQEDKKKNISNPSNFEHVSSGAISTPSNFQHLASGRAEGTPTAASSAGPIRI